MVPDTTQSADRCSEDESSLQEELQSSRETDVESPLDIKLEKKNWYTHLGGLFRIYFK